jgi:hypothetical protein
VHGRAGRAEPAEVDVHRAQARRDPRKRELLARTDRHARPRPSGHVERAHPRAGGLGAQRAVAPGVELFGGDPGQGPQGSAGERLTLAEPADEVADVHAVGAGTRRAQGERPGEHAGHVVVAERGEQRCTGPLGRRSPPLVHRADERRFPGGVEVHRAGPDRRREGGRAEPRERADRADQHVAPCDERGHRRLVRDRGDGGLEVPQPLREGRQPVRVAAREHRPQAAAHHGLRRARAGVPGGPEQHDPRTHERER